MAYDLSGRVKIDLTEDDGEEVNNYKNDAVVEMTGKEVKATEAFNEDVYSLIRYKSFDFGIDFGVGLPI